MFQTKAQVQVQVYARPVPAGVTVYNAKIADQEAVMIVVCYIYGSRCRQTKT